MVEVKQLKQMFTKEYSYENNKLQCFFSPGRVNLIGEHIDYNGGMVFPAALSIGIYGMMCIREDNIVRMRSTSVEGEVIIDLDSDLIFETKDGWGNYPKGVIKYLIGSGIQPKGCDILFFNDLPNVGGLSSSAALEVLTGYMVMSQAGHIDIDRVKLALLSQEAENKFMKVNCGIMDQFSVALGKQDNAVLLNCDTLEYKYVPFKLENHSLVIMNTNKKRELAESKYNERRAECDRALEIIRSHRIIDNLCEARVEDLSFIDDIIIRNRARHVITENIRVNQAVEALKRNELEEFGALLNRSHESLKKDYEVTGLELDTVAEEAQKIKGCLGARMTGAGFGGCAIALVENNSIEELKKTVADKYTEITGLVPDFYVSVIGDGVKSL